MDNVALYQVIGMCGALEEMEKEAAVPAALVSGAQRLLTPVAGAVGRAATKGVGRIKATPGDAATWARGVPGRTVEWARGVPGRTKEWLAQGGRTERLKGRLATSGLGAAAGAGYGAATGEEGTRAERALSGALLGGLGGLALGQVATGAGRRQLERAAHRQLHGMTGLAPKKSLTGFAAPGTSATAVKGSTEGLSKLEKARRLGIDTSSKASQAAVEQGLTSVPGFLKGLATRPGQTLRTGVRYGGPLVGLGMAGLTATQVPGALRQAELEGGGKAENIGRIIGEGVGYTAGAPVPIVGNIALGSILGQAGKYIGKGVGALTGDVKPKPAPRLPIREGM